MVRTATAIHCELLHPRGVMEPTPTFEPPVLVEAPPPEPRGIAPVWHTLLFIAIFAGLTLGGTKRSESVAGHAKWPLYVETIVMQWLLVLYAWWGLRLRGRTMREIVGGRWEDAEAVLTDVLIAIGFFFANIMVRAIVLGVMMAVSQGFKTMSIEGVQKVAQKIGPQSMLETLLFMGVAVTAGICEEILFRGYLQQQLAVWTKSTTLGVILSAILFCAGHAYQGWLLAVQVGILGLMLGILAAWRKSLRPGIIAHGMQDVISGLLSKVLLSRVH